MKIKTLVPFIVVLALLLGLLAWRKANEAPPAPIATQVGLITLAPTELGPEDISRIEMYTGEELEQKVILERNEESWQITSLFDAPVDGDTLDTFLTKTLALKGEPRSKENTEEQLGQYSLKDSEAFHVQLFKPSSDDAAMHVLVGKSPDYRTVFVRKSGDSQVFVESTNLRKEAGVRDSGEETSPQSTQWLQKTLLEQNKETITRITLQYPNKKIVFEKKEVIVETPEKTEGENEGTNEGETPSIPVEPEAKFEWVLSQGGFAKNYTEQELETLLTKFAMLTISDVADPDRKEEWGFSPPLYKLTISRNDGDDIVLLGGHNTPGGDSYVQLEDAKPALIFEIAKYNFEQIFPQGSKLFSLPEWTIEKDTIGRIEIQRTDGQVVLIKEEEKWRVIEPAIDLELQKTTIDSLLTAASSLKPVDYVDSNEDIGLFDTTVIISTNDGKSRTLYLGQPSKHTDGRYVKFDDSKNILVLSRTDIEKIEPPMRDLFTLSLLDFDQKIIGSVAVNHNETNLLLERNPADGEKWQCTVNGKQSETLLNNVEEFIYTLNAFQVDNFLLEQSPDAVQVVSTITVNQMEKAPVMIQLSAENNGMYQAVISGLPYVFSVKTDEVSRIIDDMQVFLDIPEEKDAAEEVTTQIKAPDAIPVDGVNILETDAAGSENAVEIVIPSLETTANEDI